MLTFEEIKTLYENDSRKILDKELRYVGKNNNKRTTYIKYECLVDGYIGWSSISNMKKGYGCPKCGDSLKYTLEDVVYKLKNINQNIKILSTEYVNATSKLKCKCLIDGHVWEASWNNLKTGKGCPECGKKKSVKSKRLPKDLVFNTFINHGYTPFRDSYVNTLSYISAINSDGYKIYSKYSNFINKGFKSSFFNKNNPYTIDNIKTWLSYNNPTIELMSDVYINSNQKLKCKCKIDGNIFYMAWTKIKQKHGCMECVARKNKGSTHPSWKGGTTSLNEYLRCKLSDWKKLSFEKFNYKCDITNSNKNLEIHHLIPFNRIVTEVLTELDLNIKSNIKDYTEYELESILLKFKEYHIKYGTGVCLCKKEHDLLHKYYGKLHITPENYYEFKNNRLKELRGE